MMSTTTIHTKKIYPFEAIMLGLLLILSVTGIIVCFNDKKYFENVFTSEDGFVEYSTLIPLSIAFGVCMYYLIVLSRQRSWMFTLCVILAALFSFFVMGEEVSWGQRIFHVSSSEFFKEHNAQGETNLHNLVVDGEKINKIIFTFLLSILVALYMFLLPYLYKKKLAVRNFIDRFGIPVPRPLHILSMLVFGILLAMMQSPKNSEILEVGVSTIFLLILLYPQNLRVFRK
ncbi:hypothetical protein ACFQZX_10735 [Mucilaginibacter litoreus]|uniref:Uncharacterized protein n=1 Tax=Mucilaginibacter litoreus TaxID=1048221 RepID=A0ABW3ATA5_9SPHI